MKKLLGLLTTIVLLTSCGLGNNILILMKAGAVDENGNVPASISSCETQYQSVSALGEHILLGAKAIPGSTFDSLQSLEFHDYFSHFTFTVFDTDGTTEKKNFTDGLSSYSDRYFGFGYLDADDFTEGETYTWQVQLTHESSSYSEEVDYWGVVNGPWTFTPRETLTITQNYGEDEDLGNYPAVMIDSAGILRTVYFKSDFEINLHNFTSGSWGSPLTYIGSSSSASYDQGDVIDLAEDASGTFHMMRCRESALDYYTWTPGDADFTPVLETGEASAEDSLDSEPQFVPSMAVASDGTASFLYYDDGSDDLLFVSSADFNSPQIVDGAAGNHYPSYTDGEMTSHCKLLIDSTGKFHAIYTNNNQDKLEHSTSTDGTNWSTPVTIVSGEGYAGLDAEIMTATDAIHISYLGEENTSDDKRSAYYAVYQTGSWSAPVEITDKAYRSTVRTRLFLDSAGNPYLLIMQSSTETSETPNNLEDRLPLLGLWREGSTDWEMHAIDLGSVETKDYSDSDNRDVFQFNGAIDTSGHLHLIFKEYNELDYSITKKTFVKHADLTLSDLTFE